MKSIKKKEYFLPGENRKPISQALTIILLATGILAQLALISTILTATLIPLATALTGYYSLTSPFSCGPNCSGGAELSGHDYDYCYYTNPVDCFNTIDECMDGDDPGYEFVEDITITNLNGTYFNAGDTITIDAYLDCDSDEDQVVFAYNNGSGFRSINYTTCKLNGKTNKYYDLTLDNNGGNHTVRVIIAYKGLYPEFGEITCGDQAPEAQWSDTDDVTFYVQGPSDNEPPQVTNPIPEPGTTYEKQEDLEVLICVEALDDIAIDSVLANITWGYGSELLQLFQAEKNTYCDGFSAPPETGIYNVSFIANDTSGKTNDSVTTYFVIEHTTNITLHSPTQGALFAYGPIPLNFTIGQGYEYSSVFYSLDRQANTTMNSGKVNVSFTVPDSEGAFGENTTVHANLSMSFKPLENMSVKAVGISLKRSGSGAQGAQFQIRTDDSGKPSETVLAGGNITNASVSADDYSFVEISLNTTANLEAGTLYWLFLAPNSSTPDYYSWEASDDGLYADGNYSNNASLDLLFIAYDNYKYRTAIEGVAKGNHTITVYANSSTENLISSPEINFSVDYTPPVLNAFSYAPTTAEELDPGVAINFIGNVTDNLAVAEVIIQYKKDGESEFQNASTTSSGDIYNGSVTPGSEGIWIMRMMAWDTSNNTYTAGDLTLNISYEYTWSKTPSSFNTTSALLNTNATIGNITINNTGDFSLSFNISKTPSTIPLVYFNNTLGSINISVGPGASSQVSVTATAQGIESQQPVSILIDALNESASPDYNYTNFTFISYVSGPYLDVEIIEYDATVTQGQSRITLSARITNAGNEAANNVSAYWSLPSGWSSKTNLTENYSTLGMGQQVLFIRYVNLDEDAALGEYNISVHVNCSGGKGDSDLRIVNVSSSESEQEPAAPIVIRRGGGGGSAIAPQKDARLNISIQAEVEIERGTNRRIKGFLENTGDVELKDVSLRLEEFPLSHYKIEPETLTQLNAGSTQEFSLMLNIPEYMGSGKQEASMVAKVLADNAWKEFTKALTIIVVTEDKANAIICFEDAAAAINDLESKGIIASALSTRLTEAKQKYDSNDYSLAYNLCNDILRDSDLAFRTKEQIESLNSAYARLEKDIPYLSELIKLSREAFERGEYALASQRAEQAELVIGMKKEEVQQTLPYRANIIRKNLDKILPALIIIIIIGVFAHASTSLKSLEKKMKGLELRKENIKSRIGESQRKYFAERTISGRAYEREMKHHRSSLAEVEKRKSELDIKKLGMISNRAVHDLEKVRNDVQVAKKELQKKYFVHKSIDKSTFKKLLFGLDKSLQDIDKRIALKKDKGK